MKICPNCNSTRIAHFRLDSDWGHGGNFDPSNVTSEYDPDPDAEYTLEDLDRFDQNERVDIECDVCLECSTCFN